MAIQLVMLTRPADFDTVRREGASRGGRHLGVRVVRNGLADTRFGLSTGRKVGSAVIRNRVRRRLRAILRALGPRLDSGWDVLIVARPSSAEASYPDLAGSVERLLGRAGILRDGEGAS
jgi:ribonuclease P protein component